MPVNAREVPVIYRSMPPYFLFQSANYANAHGCRDSLSVRQSDGIESARYPYLADGGIRERLFERIWVCSEFLLTFGKADANVLSREPL